MPYCGSRGSSMICSPVAALLRRDVDGSDSVMYHSNYVFCRIYCLFPKLFVSLHRVVAKANGLEGWKTQSTTFYLLNLLTNCDLEKRLTSKN